MSIRLFVIELSNSLVPFVIILSQTEPNKVLLFSILCLVIQLVIVLVKEFFKTIRTFFKYYYDGKRQKKTTR